MCKCFSPARSHSIIWLDTIFNKFLCISFVTIGRTSRRVMSSLLIQLIISLVTVLVFITYGAQRMIVRVSNLFLCLSLQVLHMKNLISTRSSSGNLSSLSIGTCWDAVVLTACVFRRAVVGIVACDTSELRVIGIVGMSFLWLLSSALRWMHFCCWASAQASSCSRRASSSPCHASLQFFSHRIH